MQHDFKCVAGLDCRIRVAEAADEPSSVAKAKLRAKIFAMIKVSILYPYGAEARFDFDCYI